MYPVAYMGMGSGTQLIKAAFKYAEGVHQGAVESGCFLHLNVTRYFKKYNTILLENGGTSVMVIIDDNYAMGYLEHIFSAHQTFGLDLVKVGLQLQPAKSQCYIAEAFGNAEWDR